MCAALVLALLTGVAGCEQRPTAASTTTDRTVYTTFYPTTYFAQRVGGPAVKVVCPAPEEADPATWQPDRETLAAYQRADLVIINGAGFEQWVARAALPESRVIDSAAPLRAELITMEEMTHSHGPGGAHTHAGLDGHTWLDPVNARTQAAVILRALSDTWPADARAMQANFDALAADLDGLDRRFTAIAPRARGALLFASHPAYNYPSRRYSLGIVNVHLDPESAPDEAAIDAIATAIAGRADAAPRIMLWEQEPVPETEKLLLERFGIRSVLFAPCEVRSSEDAASGRDYLGMMQSNFQRLEEALGVGAQPGG